MRQRAFQRADIVTLIINYAIYVIEIQVIRAVE